MVTTAAAENGKMFWAFVLLCMSLLPVEVEMYRSMLSIRVADEEASNPVLRFQ